MEPDYTIYSGLPVVSMKPVTGVFEAAARRSGDRHDAGFGSVSIEGSGSPSILASNERRR